MSQSCQGVRHVTGNSFPLSLTPTSRLMADITTSPQKPLIPINKPANNACNVSSGVSNGPIISDTIMVVITPPHQTFQRFSRADFGGPLFFCRRISPINTVQYRLTRLMPKEITPVTPRHWIFVVGNINNRGRYDSRRKRSLSSHKKWRSRYAENRRVHPQKTRRVANIRNPNKGINNRNSSKQFKPISK